LCVDYLQNRDSAEAFVFVRDDFIVVAKSLHNAACRAGFTRAVTTHQRENWREVAFLQLANEVIEFGIFNFDFSFEFLFAEFRPVIDGAKNIRYAFVLAWAKEFFKLPGHLVLSVDYITTVLRLSRGKASVEAVEGVEDSS
jgi:hypothetical protein